MAEKKGTTQKKQVHCPYCDQDVQAAKMPWCQACGVNLTVCSECGRPVASEIKECPHCGTKLAKKN
jgi:hypothetical protein